MNSDYLTMIVKNPLFVLAFEAARGDEDKLQAGLLAVIETVAKAVNGKVPTKNGHQMGVLVASAIEVQAATSTRGETEEGQKQFSDLNSDEDEGDDGGLDAVLALNGAGFTVDESVSMLTSARLDLWRRAAAQGIVARSTCGWAWTLFERFMAETVVVNDGDTAWQADEAKAKQFAIREGERNKAQRQSDLQRGLQTDTASPDEALPTSEGFWADYFMRDDWHEEISREAQREIAGADEWDEAVSNAYAAEAERRHHSWLERQLDRWTTRSKVEIRRSINASAQRIRELETPHPPINLGGIGRWSAKYAAREYVESRREDWPVSLLGTADDMAEPNLPSAQWPTRAQMDAAWERISASPYAKACAKGVLAGLGLPAATAKAIEITSPFKGQVTELRRIKGGVALVCKNRVVRIDKGNVMYARTVSLPQGKTPLMLAAAIASVDPGNPWVNALQ